MSDRLIFTVLGCGSSGGVTRIGNVWGACDPNEPRNWRRRCSMLVERRGRDASTFVLIDTTPDLRMQLIGAGIGRIDGVLYTHPHADHIHGVDDLRVLALHSARRVDVFADEQTSLRLHEAFAYCFETPPGSSYPPILTEHRITEGEPVTVEGPGGPITALPFRQHHGEIHSLGFRIGPVAYSSDLVGLPDESLPAVSGLDVWVIDALRRRPHPSHFCLDDAIGWVGRMKPRRAILTNMHVDLDYRTLVDTLPKGIEPAFDGIRFETDC
ncbi:MAG TPA: MBL fold metallo-hydrolase [Hyphomicrobiales bacterium]|nr:MBL fold metallo-hydrolase [Hyphomicrobiales bacterium]